MAMSLLAEESKVTPLPLGLLGGCTACWYGVAGQLLEDGVAGARVAPSEEPAVVGPVAVGPAAPQPSMPEPACL